MRLFLIFCMRRRKISLNNVCVIERGSRSRASLTFVNSHNGLLAARALSSASPPTDLASDLLSAPYLGLDMLTMVAPANGADA